MEAAAAPRPGRPRDERATEAILQAALVLLLERGFGAMSIEAVAERAGVGKPAVYRRFANKAELVTAAIRSILPVIEIPDTGSVQGDLDALSHQAMPIAQGPFAELLGNVLAERRRQPELLAAFRERIVVPRRDIFKTVVRRGLERGELRPGVDLEQLADVFIGSVIGRLVAGLEFDDAWRRNALETFWRGVRAEPPAAAERGRSRRRG